MQSHSEFALTSKFRTRYGIQDHPKSRWGACHVKFRVDVSSILSYHSISVLNEHACKIYHN